MVQRKLDSFGGASEETSGNRSGTTPGSSAAARSGGLRSAGWEAWQSRLRRRRVWLPLALAAVLFGLDFFSWLMAENLWFEEVGYGSVFRLRLAVRLGLVAMVTFSSGGFLLWNFRVVQRLREDDPLEIRAVQTVRSLRQWATPTAVTADEKQTLNLGLRLLLGILAGLALLLVLLLYHYSKEFSAVWQLGSEMLKTAPQLPQQLTLATLGQDLRELWLYPWIGGAVMAIAIAVVVWPWPTLVGLGGLLTLGLGFWLSTHWTHLLPLLRPTDFGITDPQFQHDISFYVFILPAWELLRFWWVGLLLFALTAVAILYLGGTDSINRGKFRGFSDAQQHHLFGLGGGLMLTVALSHWLSRYGRLYAQRGSTFFGASYADVKVQLPVDVALTAIASLIGLILLGRAINGALRSRSRTRSSTSRDPHRQRPLSPASSPVSPPPVSQLPASPPPALQRRRSQSAASPRRCSGPLRFFVLHPFLDLWLGYVLLVIVIGNLLPAAVQELVVLPNEFERERPYIERSIAATRAAFDLDSIEVELFDPSRSLTPEDLRDNQVTIDNIRLWDTRPLLDTNRQLQQIRLYYRFPDADLDRYNLNPDDPDASDQQVIIAARELDYDSVPDAAKTWVNKHLVYTHGYGYTMSPVNTAGISGLPTYFVKDIGADVTLQGNAELGISDSDVRESVPIHFPRIYYGNLTQNYVMTSTRTQELDFPSGNDNYYNVYDGEGGISIGAPWRRFGFGIYLRDWQMWLTRNFTPETRLLFRRDVASRIRAIAPFLRFDADPYLVTANALLKNESGRLVPVVSDPDRPNAEAVDSKAQRNYLYWIVDAYTTSDRYPYSAPGPHAFNYLRNPVKVVIDAYSGAVFFYVADPDDPIIQTWSHIFPSLFQPLDAMPAALRDHIRYPIDQFDIQSERMLIYHMTDPQVFYNREDQWQVPTEIYGNEPRPVEPYYLIMRLPTAEQEEFVLLHPFTPVRRNNLIAWLAGRSDGDNYGKLLLYQFPKQRLIFGPEQIEARINQEPRISQLISLWDRQGSRVIQGNLLVIPIEQSLLYVEPLYLEAERNSLPTLIRVIAAYGDRIVMEETLDAALDRLFAAEAPPAADPDDILLPSDLTIPDLPVSPPLPDPETDSAPPPAAV